MKNYRLIKLNAFALTLPIIKKITHLGDLSFEDCILNDIIGNFVVRKYVFLREDFVIFHSSFVKSEP